MTTASSSASPGFPLRAGDMMRIEFKPGGLGGMIIITAKRNDEKVLLPGLQSSLSITPPLPKQDGTDWARVARGLKATMRDIAVAIAFACGLTLAEDYEAEDLNNLHFNLLEYWMNTDYRKDK